MPKNENEIKNLSSQDKEKSSSQPKSQKNKTKKEVKPAEETPKQKKKQERKKPGNKKDVAETEKISQKVNAPAENSTSDKKEQIKETPTKKDTKVGTTSTRKSSIAKLGDKNTLSNSVEPPKSSKKVKKPVSAESLSKSNDVKSASTKEESSNIIINYFQQISEDLRAIRNFLVPEKAPEIKPEKRFEKKMREKVEPNETVNPLKKVKLSNEKNELQKEKTSKTKSPTPVKNKSEEDATPEKKDLDDSFIISKLKNKFDNGIVFSNKEARGIWLGSQGRYNMDQWDKILKNLCTKKKIIEVDNSGERIHYKLSE